MRLEKLRGALGEHNLDAILITQPENRRYLSGFTGSAGLLVITADRAVLGTDFRYFEQVGREAPDFEMVKITAKFADLIPELAADIGFQRLGYESQHVTVDQLDSWSEADQEIEWVPLKQTVEKIRAIKDENEIDALRRSTELTDDAFAHARSPLTLS